MIFESIVVAYDSSKPSQRALEKAIEICRENPACKLSVIAVVVPDVRMFPTADPIVFNAEEYQSLQQQSVQNMNALLDEHVRPLLQSLSNETKVCAISGENAADSIHEYAQEHGADLIIMGSRGLGGIRGAFGSVSKGVLARCCIPVLIIK